MNFKKYTNNLFGIKQPKEDQTNSLESKLENTIHKTETFGQYVSSLSDRKMYFTLTENCSISSEKAISWIRDSKQFRKNMKKIIDY
ncbi:hypothetical protein HOD61_00905 [archaeon]|jgi:hypothetical protein|nr:hypothetical protein [archaeon]